MNKVALAEKIVDKTGQKKNDVEEILETLEEVVIEALKRGEEVTLTGFGTFSAKTRTARMGVNPQNPKERIQIPEVVVPKFKAGKALKDALKK